MLQHLRWPLHVGILLSVLVDVDASPFVEGDIDERYRKALGSWRLNQIGNKLRECWSCKQNHCRRDMIKFISSRQL